MKNASMEKDAKHVPVLAIFQERSVRRVWYQDQWFFSVVDVITILADNLKPRRYWNTKAARQP